MIVDALNWMTEHPFWALYAAILLGIAIHGFRPATRIYKELRDELDETENQDNE